MILVFDIRRLLSVYAFQFLMGFWTKRTKKKQNTNPGMYCTWYISFPSPRNLSDMYTISIMEIQKPTYTLIGLYQPFPRFRVRVSRFRKKKKKK